MTTQRDSLMITRFITLVACLAVSVAGDAYAQPLQQGDARTIEINVGQSEIVEAPWAVRRVSVTNPNIADVEALTNQNVLLMGKAIGSTDVYLWNENEDVQKARVVVTADLEQLKEVLAQTFPHAQLTLRQAGEVMIVDGRLSSANEIVQLRKYLEISGIKNVDTSKLVGVQQVQIQIRVAEVQRAALRSLGVNGFWNGSDSFGGLTLGPSSGGALNPVSIGAPEGAPADSSSVPFQFLSDTSVNPLVTVFGGFPDADLMVFMQALSENQYLRLLAEPRLVALSGQEASFLAGGEFPIPVVQGGTANSTSISIEYKEFGVNLRFRPTVLGDNTIRLHVAPEVSEISEFGSVEIQGFDIPSIITRRAETTLELKSGQTFAMAGLLSSRKEGRNSRLPVLGDIPILGPLFRSIEYRRSETELVVLVTAHLVEPINSAQPLPLPGTLEITESDWEIFMKGRIDGRMPTVPDRAYPDTFKELNLKRLKGPGAWTDHGRPAATSRART